MKQANGKLTANGKTAGASPALRFVALMLIAAVLLSSEVFASPSSNSSSGGNNYGERAGQWLLENLLWVGIIVVAWLFIKQLLAGNTAKMIITAVAGGIALFIIGDPQRLTMIGETVWGILSAGS
jgi:hypothetical protein